MPAPRAASASSVNLLRQLAHCARALRHLEPRAERGQLHGDAWRVEQRADAPGAAPDRFDRRSVCGEITRRIRGRQRGLAEHVERIVELGRLRRALQRALDRLSHHELLTEDPHRLAQRGAHDGLADTLDEPRKERRGRFLDLCRPNDAARQQQRPGRGVDEQRLAFSQVRLPIRGAELVGDEPVGRVGVGNAQQRLGEAHQDDAFA